ncbi:MAG TPA: hypothetical protein VGK17_11300, partial [Propionicimonas sp.]
RARFIDHNPAREVKRPGTRESVSPISRALTIDQVTRLLAGIPEGVYRRYLAALMRPGSRAGSDSTEGWGHASTEEVSRRVA